MDKKLKIILKNDLRELHKVSEELELFMKSNKVPDDPVFTVHLVVEEMVSNVIKYAFKDSRQHEICLEICIGNGSIKICVEDDGIEFNPLLAPGKKTDVPLQEREIGGLGIHLVRKMAKLVEYSRLKEKNHIEITITS